MATLAFGLTCIFGHWGVYSFDQSIIFDGSWRILAGQVPYKDFLMAFTPISFAIQALFFKLCGVTWTATVISAATLGAILTLSVIRTMVILFGAKQRTLALITGGLVGISFEGIHGTLWIENCAFFFCFLGIQIVCESIHVRPRIRALPVFFAGVLAGLAFLCKQNAGPLAFALLLAMIIISAPLTPRTIITSILAFLIGTGVAISVFILWLFVYSDPHLFAHYALQVPSAVGRERLHKFGMFFFPTLMSLVSGTTTWCNAAALGVGSFVLFRWWSQRKTDMHLMADGRSRLSLLLLVVLPFMQAIFQALTLNLSPNILFITPLTLGLTAGVCAQWFSDSTYLPLLRSILILFSFLLTTEIAHSVYTRDVMIAYPPHAKLAEKLTIPPLNHVSWINPTYATNARVVMPDTEGIILPQDVEKTYQYLSTCEQRFFVMGDSNYLYGITGVTPPGPMLYFQDNHYYTTEDLPALDDWTLANLKRDNIRLVVEEKRMFCYSVFPLEKTRQWIEKNFSPGPVFGHYAILLRKT